MENSINMISSDARGTQVDVEGDVLSCHPFSNNCIICYCHTYSRIYQETSETNAAVMAVETHTIHKLEDGIGEFSVRMMHQFHVSSIVLQCNSGALDKACRLCVQWLMC